MKLIDKDALGDYNPAIHPLPARGYRIRHIRYKVILQTILRNLFHDSRRWLWCEGPFTEAGKQCSVFHYRLFCNPEWQPLKPRGEVYNRDFTEAGWKSFSELHRL